MSTATPTLAHLRRCTATLTSIPLPDIPSGVYFLLLDEQIVYVGQSTDPISRLAQHRKEGRKEFNFALLLAVPEIELNEAEGAFIRYFCPRYNEGAPVANIADDRVLARYGFAAAAVELATRAVAPMPEYLPLHIAAQRLGVPAEHLRRAHKGGRLPAYATGASNRSLIFRQDDLIAFMESLRVTP